MPPTGGNKRKRGDRTYSEDDMSRPSPHRPGNLDLARHNQYHSPSAPRGSYENRSRGNRRSSRGGRHPNDPPRAHQQNSFDGQHSVHKSPTTNLSSPNPVTRLPADAVALQILPLDPEPILRPFEYVYLTEKVRESWHLKGKQEIQAQLRTANESGDEIQQLSIMQELIYAANSKALQPKDAGEVLHGIVTDRDSDAAQNLLLDALSIAFEDNQSLPRQHLVEFIVATGISEDVLRQEFDQDLLQKLGMIRSTFGRMGIRKQTNVLYRQANFNLMREESEGFAKLMTELFTTSGNEPPTGEVVEETVEQVKAMIGAFDLDVGRSLDVVLDVFGAVLVKQFRFFVKFLRASPWWPRVYDNEVEKKLGGLPAWAIPGVYDWKISDKEQAVISEATRARDTDFWPHARRMGLKAFQQVGRVAATDDDLRGATEIADGEFALQWMKETGTVPVAANRDAAQLLGFKLRYYSSATARDPNDTLPDHLIYLSALLIKIGFISLTDLYPHIWRSDEEMGELKEQKLKEKLESVRAARPGAGVKNALLLAGALADDTLPVPPRLRESTTRAGTPAKEPEVDKTSVTGEVPDQKILLLKSLLAIGALPEALFILGRFPWVLDLYPELPEYIHRILHHSLSHVYDNLRPLRSRDSLHQQQPFHETDMPGIAKGHVKLTDPPQKRTLRWAQLDKCDSSDGTDYRFYWDEWNDNIPTCQNVEDVFTLCHTILPLVGVKIGQDPSLILKLTRIGKYSIKTDPSEENRNRWLDLIKKVLLPCLSLTKPNAGVINEVFDFISQYSTNVRYVMYLEWSSGRISRNPDVKAAFDQAKAETKDILKRISKTNVKPMARSLAKVAYANPHVVITTALAQIEVYDSIAEVFVEGSRYFTDLGYDVLNWALISSMARAGRSRTQEGGIFTSRWLSALSQFAGKIYKRYSMMKPGPVLQYVSEQLDKGNSTDLKMLEQIIVAMAGIATDTSFNDAQLQAMGGGALLQAQTILQLLDRRNDSKTSSKRLVKSLQDHGLTAKFLLSMAQQRQACVFEESDVPLKAIGNTFDEIHRIMYQYLDLLSSNLSFEDFQKTIPDVAKLLIDYEIPTEVAFWIARPILARQMKELENGLSQMEARHDADKDPESSEEDGEAVETETAATPSESDINDVMETDLGGPVATQTIWNPVLKAVMDQIEPHLPHSIVGTIGVGFFVTFWQLALYDINVPSKSYEDEMNRQRKKILSITADRSNISASGAKQRENAVKQHQQLIDDLLAENKEHLKAYSESRLRLQKEKDQWFAHKPRQSTEINTALMEYCFLPRMLSSPQDAFFCFKFIKFLHSNSTPNFRTLGFYDAFMKPDRITSLVFMCTSKESDNLGRFLCELLRDLARWHKDKNVYEREAYGSKIQLPGFAMKVENGKPQVLLEFENFRKILFKWHSNLYSALTKCLSSPEYMHVRNAISILRAISPVYPAVNFHGTALQKHVKTLGESDREDLKVASQALLGALHRRQKEWILPHGFRQGQTMEKLGDNIKEEFKGLTNPSTAVKGEDDGEAGEVNMIDVAQKPELEEQKPNGKVNIQPPTRPLSVDSSNNQSTVAETSTVRQSGEPLSSSRRSTRAAELSDTHELPRKLSPTRHGPLTSLPSRPDLDGRNGLRDSPRVSGRPLPTELPRSNSRSSHSRYPHTDRNQEAPYEQHRHARTHLPERDERTSRRDHELRRPYDERVHPEREPRREREHESRNERDSRSGYVRSSDREPRLLDRDMNRPPFETPDRKMADLVDDRRPTAPSSTRDDPLAVPINPERAALINNADRPGMSIRGQAQEKSRSSGASSPKRDEDRRPQRVEREERSGRSDRDRLERSERPDRSERLERHERHDLRQESSNVSYPSRSNHSNNHNRDSRSFNPPPIDMQHGRLEPDSPNRPLPRSERLVPETEVPSGPRTRPSSGSRRGPSSGSGTIQPPPLERPPPTGPAKHTRGATTIEVPNAGVPDTSGVHPDRMNLVTPQDTSRPPPRPPPVNTQAPPPSGPRSNSTIPPSGPSPITRGPPTGPQSDAAGRGRRHPIAAVNNTLAQASGPAGRGRGGPRQSGHYPPPAQPPVQGSRPDFTQSDPSNPNGVPVQPRPGTNRRESTKDARSEEESRSGRRPDNRSTEESRRNERREEVPRDQRNYRNEADELPPRKHHRQDSGQYLSGPSRGGRPAADGKRPRRGG